MTSKSSFPKELSRFYKEKTIRDIINNLDEPHSVIFTNYLRKFELKFGKYSISESKTFKWEVLATYLLHDYSCFTIATHRKINILRFLRYLVLSKETFFIYYQLFFGIYLSILKEKNGNLRNAAYYLLDNSIFSFSIHVHRHGKNKDGQIFFDMRRSLLSLFLTLLDLHNKYILVNKIFLKETDYKSRYYIPASQTKNTYLKTIRRGIEVVDTGYYFDKILEEFGYLEMLRSKSQINRYLSYKNEFNIT